MPLPSAPTAMRLPASWCRRSSSRSLR